MISVNSSIPASSVVVVSPGLTLDETNHSGWEIAHHFLFFDLHVLSYGIADVDDVSLFEIKIVSLD